MKKHTLISKLSGIFLSFAIIMTMLPYQVMADDSGNRDEAATTKKAAAAHVVKNNGIADGKGTAVGARAKAAKNHKLERVSTSEMAAATIAVVDTDGKPIEDGFLFDLDDPEISLQREYKVKDGKIKIAMRTGKEYRLGISWNEPKFNDYKLIDADPNLDTIPMAIPSEGKGAVWYDRHTKTMKEDKPISVIRLQKLNSHDDNSGSGGNGSEPAPGPKEKVNKGEVVNVKDIKVETEDGKPLPDGVQIDVFDMTEFEWTQKLYVKDGKISGVKLKAERQYKIGMDVPRNNPFYNDYELIGAYKSKHLMGVYGRYQNDYPLYYDYDEGFDAPEKPISKLVFHKLKNGEDSKPIENTSCTVGLLLSNEGYAPKGELPFKLIRKDNGKIKKSPSKGEGLDLVVEGGVKYELVLDKNDTYKMRDKIEFTMKKDRNGVYQPVREGYDVEDLNGRLTLDYIHLVRIDGKKPNGDNIEEIPSDYHILGDVTPVWKAGSGDMLFVIKAKSNDKNTFNHFKGIEVDGVAVDKKDYTATAGSVRISLKAEFLSKLKPGRHKLKVNFDNGSSESEFMIAAASISNNGTAPQSAKDKVANKAGTRVKSVKTVKTVKTGDETGLGSLLLLVMAAVAFVYVNALRKRKN